ncbi:hypothetical protein C3K47_05050 [Solitalea longa]|uniref:Uncharacterized protein n=1 Tax=Solitalea longa TaxID=2079460 RepID=A0A2S5A6H9_9SPHI|nr:hypothetical protein [Solitalea longa]POY37897.1 hypothetical protein C3K47_05050 [Solitalea longa]
MKKIALLLIIALASIQVASAQKKWADLSKEEKVSKAKAFRADNQNYLKTTLGMTPTQLTDIDNVNACYLSTLDRIDRYGKTDEDKEKLAEFATAARSAQLDAIMGTEKRDKFVAYVQEKLKKAGVNLE